MTDNIPGGNPADTRKSSASRTALWLAAGLLVAATAAPTTADARGFVSFGFGVPLGGPPAYYYPPPPPVYYYPPPGRNRPTAQRASSRTARGRSFAERVKS